MLKQLTISLFLLTLSITSFAGTKVQMDTNMGNIIIELNDKKAPVSVKNFLKYVNNGHYKGTIFHRVINGFMIQGGGYDKNYKKVEPESPIKNEASNGLENNRGTIAMARTNAPHSATAQFFINVKNNSMLNHTSKTPRGWGYAVFGKVINGMNVVDKIKNLKTGSGGPFRTDAPKEIVIIKNIKIIK